MQMWLYLRSLFPLISPFASLSSPQSLTRLRLLSPVPFWKRLGEEGAAAPCEQEAGDRAFSGIHPLARGLSPAGVEGEELPGRSPALCL